MKLIGKVQIDSFNYYVVLNDLKKAQTWFLFSEIHPKNYSKIGAEMYKDSIDYKDLLSKNCSEYIVEAITRTKVKGTSKFYKGTHRLNKIMKAFIDCRDYSYSKNNSERSESINMGVKTEYFYGASERYSIDYRKQDGLYEYIKFNDGELEVVMTYEPKIKIPRSLEYQDLKDKDSRLEVERVAIDNVDKEKLGKMIDLSWYQDPTTGVKKKHYDSATNIREMEYKCVTPLIYYIRDTLKKGERPYFSMDTETEGFNLLYLDDANPEKDHISTMQFSWEDDQGVALFIGMEYFDNINKDYVLNRFYDLLKYGKHKVKFKVLYDLEGNKLEEPEEYEFNREDYDLLGHNSMFDSRVTLSEGCQYFFNEDTLQMAFNIDPSTTKRNKGLKKLTQYFFGYTPSELSDILGKGNEDKFRLLRDREVAEIYGCADADGTRKIWKPLRALMSDKMYKKYKQLDPIIWYLGARSEYYGMRVDTELISSMSKNLKSDLKTIRDVVYHYVGLMIKIKTLQKLHSFDGHENDEVPLSSDDVYEFNLTGDDVRRVMYNILEYPVIERSEKTGDPCVNKTVMEKLLRKKLPEPSGILKDDIIGADGETVLISAKKFNSYRYPLCYLLQVYSSLNKEYTGYYKPFETDDMEGRLFKGISTTNIETRRISSPAQTVKKNIKKAIIAHGDDWYCADWDLAQVEPRIFESEARDLNVIGKLKNPEIDYHTENAALMFKLPAYKVPSSLRKKAKPFGIGIPYGLSDFRLCERLGMEHTRDNEFETRRLKGLFENANQDAMNYLNGIRNKALEPAEVSDDLLKFWGFEPNTKVGLVYNRDGFYRYFNLTQAEGNKKKEMSIQRMAGNYPIQSFAADLYRLLILRFFDKIREYGLEDKFIFHMYIHDEIFFSVHKSVDPRTVAKIVQESCVITLPGHTTYFVGLNFGDSWYDCKNDENEIPATLLYRIAKNHDSYKLNEWTDDPKKVILPMIEQYTKDRALEVIRKYQPNFEVNGLNAQKLYDGFTNYTVRKYILEQGESYKPRQAIDMKNEPVFDGKGKAVKDELDTFVSCLCSLLVYENLSDVRVVYDDTLTNVSKYIEIRNESNVEEPVEFNELELFDYSDEDEEDAIDKDIDLDTFYSFDEDEDKYYSTLGADYDYSEDEEDTEIYSNSVHREYTRIRNLGSIVKINIDQAKYKDYVLNLIRPYMSKEGSKVFLETGIQTFRTNVRYSFTAEALSKLDDEIQRLVGGDMCAGV